MFADRTIQVGLGRQNEMEKEPAKAPFWGPSNLKRRQNPRFSINLQGVYCQNKASESKLCQAVNISKGGLQLYVSEELEVGRILKLKILIDSKHESNFTETDVQVVWAGNNPRCNGYRIGVRFVNISPSSLLFALAKGGGNLEKSRDKNDKDKCNHPEIDAKLARILLLLGIIYMCKDDHNNAILYFHKSIELAPDRGEPYFYRGFTYYRKRVYRKSWEDTLKARELGFRVPEEFLQNLNRVFGGSKEFLDHFNKGL